VIGRAPMPCRHGGFSCLPTSLSHWEAQLGAAPIVATIPVHDISFVSVFLNTLVVLLSPSCWRSLFGFNTGAVTPLLALPLDRLLIFCWHMSSGVVEFCSHLPFANYNDPGAAHLGDLSLLWTACCHSVEWHKRQRQKTLVS